MRQKSIGNNPTATKWCKCLLEFVYFENMFWKITPLTTTIVSFHLYQGSAYLLQPLVVVTLAILPMGKWRLPTDKDVYVCNRFPQTETVRNWVISMETCAERRLLSPDGQEDNAGIIILHGALLKY